MPENPFGDDNTPPPKVNPFGDEPDAMSPAAAAARVRTSAQKIRGLRMRMGAEGLTLSGTRELIDNLSSALDAVAAALSGLEE